MGRKTKSIVLFNIAHISLYLIRTYGFFERYKYDDEAIMYKFIPGLLLVFLLMPLNMEAREGGK